MKSLGAKFNIITFISCVSILGCTASKQTKAVTDKDAESLHLTQAASFFSTRPRTAKNVLAAYRLVTQSIDNKNRPSQTTYEQGILAAKYALWLAINDKETPGKLLYATAAKKWCRAAIQINAEKVQGFYYYAIAIGVVAEINRAAARQSMAEIRGQALKAIALNEHFDDAGPHRLLGALYLRAPGPPTGIGSKRRALHHLEKAYELAPENPENMNFLAEAYIKFERRQEALALIEIVLAGEWPDGQLISAAEIRQHALSLKQKGKRK